MTSTKFFTIVMPSIVIAAVVAILFPVAGRAASPDFESVVFAVQQRYNAHVQRVPMMGLISFCAHVMTRGGVRGMKIAEFDHLNLEGPENLAAAGETPAPDSSDLESLVHDTLGDSWRPFVVEHARSGEENIIYVQPDGSSMRMLIADYENGELDLIRMEVNGERLSHWVHDPQGSARNHSYSAGDNASD